MPHFTSLSKSAPSLKKSPLFTHLGFLYGYFRLILKIPHLDLLADPAPGIEAPGVVDMVSSYSYEEMFQQFDHDIKDMNEFLESLIDNVGLKPGQTQAGFDA